MQMTLQVKMTQETFFFYQVLNRKKSIFFYSLIYSEHQKLRKNHLFSELMPQIPANTNKKQFVH